MRLSRLPAFASILLLSGCYGSDLFQAEDSRQATDPSELASAPAEDVFEAAATAYGVPADLLTAVAWHRSSFAPGDDDHGEHAPAFGWLALDETQLALAAELTELTPDAVRHERESSVFAGAAVLAELQRQRGAMASARTADERWWPALVAFGGYAQDWMNHEFARDVFGTLQEGLYAPTVSGDIIELAPREIPGLADVPFVSAPSGEAGAFSGGTDYPGAARFVAAHSSNQSSRSNGTASINRVVLHTTEGSYNGAISWFQNPSSNVSAHFVIRRSDGEVTEMVRHSKRAWHACSNNNDTVGIEHEGASSNAANWTPQILDASARLTAWLVTQYNIPIDRNHIVGHGEIQPASCSYRYDPGPHFPWTQYMQMVQNYASGGVDSSPPPDELAPPSLPDPPAPGTIAFQSPDNGATVGNPVIMRIAHSNLHHAEVWAGAYRLARDLTANPVNVGYLFNTTGERTITAKGYNAAGAVIATDTITVHVTNLGATLSPSATKVDGATYRMSTTTGGVSAATVRYWVDGWPLKDINSGIYSATAGPSYPLSYTFSYLGPGRLLQARAYDSAGNLVAEGFNYIDVTDAAGTGGGILDFEGQEAAPFIVRLTTETTPGVAYVQYLAGGAVLTSMENGADRAWPDEFAMYVQFEENGPVNIEVRAYDSAGGLLDSSVQTVVVPGDSLEVSWQRTSWHHYHFDAEAPAGTYKVVIEIDGWALPDETSGEQFTLGPDFLLQYTFNYGGSRTLVARAIDPVGNVIDEIEMPIEVY